MIQMQTKLEVADNSGAKLVKCVKVLGGSKRMTASIGDVIVVAVQQVLPGRHAKDRNPGRRRPLRRWFVPRCIVQPAPASCLLAGSPAPGTRGPGIAS